jgi:hypothetical protein
VETLQAGDVVFSLISGTAAISGPKHQGFFPSHNFIRLIPGEALDPGWLVYLLNENRGIKKQFAIGLQGSRVIKYTVRQLRKLTLPPLPPRAQQQAIGAVYLKQLRLEALKIRAARRQTQMRLHQLKEIMQ